MGTIFHCINHAYCYMDGKTSDKLVVMRNVFQRRGLLSTNKCPIKNSFSAAPSQFSALLIPFYNCFAVYRFLRIWPRSYKIAHYCWHHWKGVSFVLIKHYQYPINCGHSIPFIHACHFVIVVVATLSVYAFLFVASSHEYSL